MIIIIVIIDKGPICQLATTNAVGPACAWAVIVNTSKCRSVELFRTVGEVVTARFPFEFEIYTYASHPSFPFLRPEIQIQRHFLRPLTIFTAVSLWYYWLYSNLPISFVLEIQIRIWIHNPWIQARFPHLRCKRRKLKPKIRDLLNL